MCFGSKPQQAQVAADPPEQKIPDPTPIPSPSPSPTETATTQVQKRKRIAALRFGALSTIRNVGGAKGLPGPAVGSLSQTQQAGLQTKLGA